MGKNGVAIVTILAALAACGGRTQTVPYASAPAVVDLPRHLGQLHVEPYEIVFEVGSSQSQTIRVWQSGWHERYRMKNGCSLVSVKLLRYVRRNVSIWQAMRVGIRGKERCAVTFTGSRGSRGTNSVEIRVRKRR